MTQNKEILKALQDGMKITPLEALAHFDCLRLSARIHNLRALGYNIKTDNVTVKLKNGNTKTFARYELT